MNKNTHSKRLLSVSLFLYLLDRYVIFKWQSFEKKRMLKSIPVCIKVHIINFKQGRF